VLLGRGQMVAGFLALGVIVSAGAFSTNTAPDYVVTAIDYHFHDAHPTLPIGPGRDLVVKNEGSNVHNVTIIGTDFSQDLPPGEQIRIPDIATFLGGSGTYSFYCQYHKERGMVGVIIIGSE
jgi:plastocyanin